MGEHDIEDAEFEKVPKKKFDCTFWVCSVFIIFYIILGYYYLFSDF